MSAAGYTFKILSDESVEVTHEGGSVYTLIRWTWHAAAMRQLIRERIDLSLERDAAVDALAAAGRRIAELEKAK